ncbi:MAG: malto-oligosyltrehalose synthase [Actinomycetota bacterium]|nr:malto-oligosyltrehalose synthase [Actinomycetota bacterium]
MSDHLPADDRSAPLSTYRVQLRAEFGFEQTARIIDYLADLGVETLYFSPFLTASPGSAHGYDVTDHAEVSPELGGEDKLRQVSDRLRAAGMRAVLDVVPNHMTVPVPESLNAQWWDVLRLGPQSPHAPWFDIDWQSPDNPGQVLLPVLGRPLGECIRDGELSVEASGPDSGPGGEPVLRYYDHVFPLAPGTADRRGDLVDLLAAQHYRLAYWRVAAEELNYRRFFDVTTLAGVRVEEPAVFDATHEKVLSLLDEGVLSGLRIDHPDGLADPQGYLDRLAERTGGAWVVAEKILEHGEQLPPDWACAGTTGYDALNSVLSLSIDPANESAFTALYEAVTGADTALAQVVEDAKRLVVRDILSAEVNRLVRLLGTICRADPTLRDNPERWLREALVEVLTATPVYRAYVRQGEEPDPVALGRLDAAVSRATERLPARAAQIALIREAALGRAGTSASDTPAAAAASEFVTRFQQTTGPVMAKGLEDTAFYRYLRFTALNEVGGDPGAFGGSPQEFAKRCEQMQRDWPATMTTLSTHDTKRSEDVRARIAVLSEMPAGWADAVTYWRAAAARHRTGSWPDGPTEYLFWQTLVGAWPLPADRALAYLEKASREAKLHTSWTDPDQAYDEALARFVRGVLDDPVLMQSVEAFVTDELLLPGWINSLAAKLVQLTMPGVPDVYQGSELWDLSLVDPDNRRPVDYETRRRLLAELDTGSAVPDVDGTGAAKLLVVSRALRARRQHPAAFGADGTYAPLTVAGSAAEHLVGFVRGNQLCTLAPRLVVGLRRHGGWNDTTVELPDGRWRNALTGAVVDGGRVGVADVLADFPVALLIREEEAS